MNFTKSLSLTSESLSCQWSRKRSKSKGCCWIFERKKTETVEEVCAQCGGSGRVTVSAKMVLDIRPYKPKDNQ